MPNRLLPTEPLPNLFSASVESVSGKANENIGLLQVLQFFTDPEPNTPVRWAFSGQLEGAAGGAAGGEGGFSGGHGGCVRCDRGEAREAAAGGRHPHVVGASRGSALAEICGGRRRGGGGQTAQRTFLNGHGPANSVIVSGRYSPLIQCE